MKKSCKYCGGGRTSSESSSENSSKSLDNSGKSDIIKETNNAVSAKIRIVEGRENGDILLIYQI